MSMSLISEGFEPQAVKVENGWDFVLENCPYVEVASVDPSTVCQIHLGLLEGLFEKLDPAIELGLTIRDPRRAGCRVRLRSTADALGSFVS